MCVCVYVISPVLKDKGQSEGQSENQSEGEWPSRSRNGLLQNGMFHHPNGKFHPGVEYKTLFLIEVHPNSVPL